MRHVSLAVLVSWFLIVPNNATAAASFRWLGIWPGKTDAGANDVSADGSVVVGTNYGGNSSLDWRAYRWTTAGGMQLLTDSNGGYGNNGSGVSADGSTVLGSGVSTVGLFRAWKWTSGGQLQDISGRPAAPGMDWAFASF